MALAIRTTDFPVPAGPNLYDGVTAAMDIAYEPPEGLIFHWAGEVDGKWTVMDVWEAREAYDRFREERLFPAIREVSGMDPATVHSRRSRSSRSTTPSSLSGSARAAVRLRFGPSPWRCSARFLDG
jgi:hypothetical protein